MSNSSIIKMNCLGDSITYGYSNKKGEPMKQSYPILLKEMLNFNTVRNYGINGSTIAEGENPMYIRYKNMDDNADIVSVLGGTNDYGRTQIDISPLGTFGDKNGNTVYGALDILCDGLKQKYPNSFIFFMTPLHCGNDKIPNKYSYTLKDVKIAIEQVCSKYEIPVLNLFDTVDFIPENKDFLEKYCVDDWHPNQKFVKEILANKIANFMKQSLENILSNH